MFRDLFASGNHDISDDSAHLDYVIGDLFAGGGGASEAIRLATGRSPDFAINHDAEAVGMHAANHPETLHLCKNVWQCDPDDLMRTYRGPNGSRRLGLLWLSPDCKHFSKAKGTRPVKRNVRDLAWTAVLWAKRARPLVIILENVEEFQDWGPLLVRQDGRHVPDRTRLGQTFDRFVAELRRLGYRAEWRKLRACDYGTPTIRKRLVLIARCDGLPIAWPEPTHSADPDDDLPPWRTAADCIDWSLPCPSIFLTREQGRAANVNRPLAENTLRRIARGVRKFVLDAGRPFIVPVTHQGDTRHHAVDEPLRTITTAKRGEFAYVAPFLVPRYGERPGQAPRWRSIEQPFPVVVPTGNGAALVAAFMAQHNTGVIGRPVDAPLSTITASGAQQALVAAHLLNMKGSTRRARDLRDPAPTICAGGNHAALVAAFLMKYYGTGGQDQAADAPLHTVTTKARFGLVTASIDGADYVVTDIGMRMLTPRELYRAQGFREDYIIDRTADGKRLTKAAQTRMVGNSVCPQFGAAIIRANAPATVMSRAA